MDIVESLTGGSAKLDAAEALRKKRQTYLKSGVFWMQAVAVISGINAFAIIVGIPYRLIIGMAFTDFAVALAKQLGPAGIVLAVFATIAVAGGIFALAWIFKKTGRMWTAIVVIAVYSLDIIPTLLLREYISAAFHVIAVSAMIQGLQAFRALQKEQAASAGAQAVPVQVREVPVRTQPAQVQPQVAQAPVVEDPVQVVAAPAQVVAAPVQPVVPAVPAGWYSDPSGRHQYRYWDSRQWTRSVLNNGEASIDSAGA